MKKRSLIFVGAGVLSLYGISSSYADLNCTLSPDCDTLGYTLSADDCADSAIKVACPTDTSKMFCKIPSMPILYGDGTVSNEILSDKTPIGIVVDAENYLAVALTDIDSDGSAGSSTMKWSSSYCDTPNLDNCTDGDGLTSCGTDGRANTDAILASTCNGTTYAANGANEYTPSGCSKDFCKKTKWFLPSMRDLITLYNAKSTVNASLSLTASSGAETLTESYYWSSTEYVNANAWRLDMSDGSRGNGIKANANYSISYVRPFVYYGPGKPVTCTVGSILGGDQLCYSPDSGTPEGVEPVGIVFDATNQLAVALTGIDSDGSAGSTTMYWSSSYCDTPNLDNCTSHDGLTSCGVDGRTNTNAILASTCNGTTYAANGANEYTPSGCSKDFCKKTKWFLPSMRDLITLYNAKSYVNASLSLTASSGAETMTESYYWSSTEYNSGYAWRLGVTNGYRYYGNKGHSNYVRPVVKY